LLQNVLDLLRRHFARPRHRIVCRAIDAAVDAVVIAPLGQFDIKLTEA
jgi:hypothetical protein